MSSIDQLKKDAVAIWKAGVDSVNARKLVRENVAWSKDELRVGTEMFPIPEIDRLLIVGFGKASGAMAAGFEDALADRLYDTFEVTGWVNVPDDQVVETQAITVNGCRPAGENLPTRKVIEGTDKILEMIRSAGPNDIVVCLISGGGSALLEKPIEPITLDQLRETSSFLSDAGASIYELNAVRRALSQVKGGRLALESGGAPIVSLILSDVVGDELSVIASGPTAIASPQPNAVDVLNKYDADQTLVAESVWKVVESIGDDSFPKSFPYGVDVTNTIIANFETAINAARENAIELGYDVATCQPNGNEGNAEEVGRSVAGLILSNEHLDSQNDSQKRNPVCQIMAGETTMIVCQSPGRGGRNQHLVLSAMDELLGHSTKEQGASSQNGTPTPQETNHFQFCILSGGTDGEDGNSPAAGAWFDSNRLAQIIGDSGDCSENQRSEIKKSLAACDSHSILSQLGLTLETEQTFTNVCDLRIVLQCFGSTPSSST